MWFMATLMADDGQPIFPELAPPPPVPEAVASVADAVTPVPTQQIPNPVPPTAAEPPAAESSPTGDVAEPIASEPETQATEPPAPEPFDWDDPANPWRQQAETAQQQADATQQELLRRQAYELQQSEQQSLARQRALLQRRVQLDANVGQYSTEDFQRASYALNQEIARELATSNASKQAITEHFAGQQNALLWDQAVAQTTSAYGLTPQEVNYVNQNARDDAHMEQIARDFKARREEQSKYRSVTAELAKLKSAQQNARSQAAAQSRESGVDRSAGVGSTPVPTAAPTSALGLLRQTVNGDPNVPVTVR
jgi:hypothetical protein